MAAPIHLWSSTLKPPPLPKGKENLEIQGGAPSVVAYSVREMEWTPRTIQENGLVVGGAQHICDVPRYNPHSAKGR